MTRQISIGLIAVGGVGDCHAAPAAQFLPIGGMPFDLVLAAGGILELVAAEPMEPMVLPDALGRTAGVCAQTGVHALQRRRDDQGALRQQQPRRCASQAYHDPNPGFAADPGGSHQARPCAARGRLRRRSARQRARRPHLVRCARARGGPGAALSRGEGRQGAAGVAARHRQPRASGPARRRRRQIPCLPAAKAADP